MNHISLKIVFVFSIILASVALGQNSKNIKVLGTFRAGDGSANDIWGYNAPDGREYAIFASRQGTYFVDVTNPAQAKEIGYIPGPNTVWHDIKIYRHYAYIVADGGEEGMQIVDMSQLPNSVRLVKSYKGEGNTIINKSHNIWIDTAKALAFLVGGGTRVLSLKDPENPTVVTTIGVESHDYYTQGNHLLISNGGRGTVRFYDISNPSSPKLDFTVTIPNSGYSHNPWLTADGNYLMTTEETDDKTVKMWDIRDKNNPKITSEYKPAVGSMAHNVYIKGKVAFLSYYGQGFRVLDITNPANIQEIAYYRNGTVWGAYGWLNSGRFLFPTMNGVLYIVEVESILVPLGKKLIELKPFGLEARGTRFYFQLPENGSYDLKVFGLDGSLQRSWNERGFKGKNSLLIERDGISKGNYILRIEQGKMSESVGTLIQ